MDINQIIKSAKDKCKAEYGKDISKVTAWQLHNSLSEAIMREIGNKWQNVKTMSDKKRKAYYFSAEFLVGRSIQNNLLNLGILDKIEDELKKLNVDFSSLEDIEDAALGNGGLGRLAACFVESAATMNIPLDGYGIRYKFGLFKQEFENGFQIEKADDWSKYGDAWSYRRYDESVPVKFSDQTVIAVPYDMPIIGYKGENISTLRLWQAEPLDEFDFNLFNEQKYDLAVKEKNKAEDISRVLYPNDDALEGKKLRLKQQYFFSSASLQDLIRKFRNNHSENFSDFAKYNAIQLNDTHPTIAIPELIRLLVDEEKLSFESALGICKKTFAYTNHTIMQEALEKWDIGLVKKVLPGVYEVIKQIHYHFEEEKKILIKNKTISRALANRTKIIQKNTLHMAHMAIYGSSYVNGVAKIHTEIIKSGVLKDWYQLYPSKFQNKTNGITQRRWLALCNKELSSFISKNLGNDNWITNLSDLKKLEPLSENTKIIGEFSDIKQIKKQQLADFIFRKEGIVIDPDSIYDIQIKRLHEYKRQLLNILTILYLYNEIKAGNLKDFHKTTFIFGAKAAPGYKRAKSIIKLINEVAKLIDSDPVASSKLKVVFVTNYNVSYAEKLVAAADISQQVSTAGTEASGTGNMKFMLNGAVTLGTLDGANIEIVQEAGKENNYIFGATVEEINKISKTYNPMEIYKSNPEIKTVLDMLVNGTLNDDKTKGFKELYDAILKGASWHRADHYYLLYDFMSYVKTRIQANKDFSSNNEFRKKCYINMCNAGKFSSDRTVKEYAKEIWHV